MARLAYAEAGVGGRPFLLVHGFTGAKEDFTEWLDRLAADGWHAVAPDHLGHGDSDKSGDRSSYTFDALVDALLELAAERWGPNAPFVLLGHSMGGMVAEVLALREPARVSALVLMDTFHGPIPVANRADIEPALAILDERGIDGLQDILLQRGSPLDTPAHLKLCAERPGYAEFNDRKVRQTAAGAYAGLLTSMLDGPERLESLRTLTMPALVIVGEQDVPLIGQAERMADAIPNAELVVIPDAGHSPQFENPDAWWAALSSFLTRVGATV